MKPFCLLISSLLVVSATSLSASADDAKLTLKKQDHVSIIGNTTADRLQHHGWLETYIQALHPEHDLTFRNLAMPGDMLKKRPREMNFGSPDQWLTKNETDVVFAFFGFNEAFAGEGGLDQFRKDLAETIDGMLSQKYNGESAPQIVMFSPIGHENLNNRHLPDGSENNANLHLYSEAMKAVCADKQIVYVDLFQPTMDLYSRATTPLTMNGIHLLDHGNQALAEVIVKDLFGKNAPANTGRLRDAVLDKNYYWFSRYRVVDGYNVFGGRSKLAWFGQSNADVMMREMEIFDVMTANRDKRVWAVARGGDLEVKDDNLPKELDVQTNKKGDQKDGSFSYRSAEEGLKLMTLDEGLQANVFASEEMFPELVNPVQMAVDTDGILYASVWPSYPHWNPTQPRTDRILCFPDEDGNGVADECIVFADELNSVTGFEFWGGGVIVAALPELWFLKDTDGDHKADVKVRILQGLSSADSHHSANAMVLGPDGWIYWSRGIFNVAAMETPTKTYYSTQSGVHRFNPRTFEMEFHFPIGPNPHGDFFDQWGFQFANDGTSGTGSYVNIGKGVGNKKWFKKEWRPVAATGSLSSSHFPERNQGNFLVCNCIGFLGILQHEVKYNGADITAEAVNPLLRSEDPNFRPTDLEVGADGALYVSDWANALIGHMQHNMRDPNRDDQHGRIYRISAKGRDLIKPVRVKGKPIKDVCEAFYAKENATRYRARIELSGRRSAEVESEVLTWAASKDVSDSDDAQALLECLWVMEEQRLPNSGLLKTVVKAEEPRVRSAAIRTLGHWGEQVDGWADLLLTAAKDPSALVRAEAVKAALSFSGLEAAEVIFEVSNRETDPELNTVLDYAKKNINVDALIGEAIAKNRDLSPAAYKYALMTASVSDLLKLEHTEELLTAVLNRTKVGAKELTLAATELAEKQGTTSAELLVKIITERDSSEQIQTLNNLGRVLIEQPAQDLLKVQPKLEQLALNGKTEAARELAFASLVTAEGNAAAAFYSASKSKDRLRDLLGAVPQIPSKIRSEMYADVRSLMFELPPNLEAEANRGGLKQPGIAVDYYYPSASNVAIETLNAMTPKASGIVPEIVMNVPQLKQRDKFALKFAGNVMVPKSGEYTFYTRSDDGSRIYIDDKLLVNHDGLHGMSQKSGKTSLAAGSHKIVVTYFDNGGGDGLQITWSGPGMKQQPISKDNLFLSAGGDSIHDVAIRSLGSIPGNEASLFTDLADLIKAGRNVPTSISVLSGIPEQHWDSARIPGLVDNIIGHLSQIPAKFRTGPAAQIAINLTKSLATKLPEKSAADVVNRLQNLDVQVIAIGTVPARMLFDKEKLVVRAGKPVEFRINNSDHMPHNFAIITPGSLVKIGELAESTARDPDAKARHYVPKSDDILLASRLLEPGQKQRLTFEVPAEPGIYPYVCTYPGHWRRMFGAMYVVDDVESYKADPAAYLAANRIEARDELLTYLDRNTEWKLSDLAEDVEHLAHRSNSFDVGQKLFTVASCIGCHAMNGKGANIGPDLTKLDPKYSETDILMHILEPSKKIDKKYQTQQFVMASGRVITGLVVKEDADSYHVLDNPTAPDKLRVLKKDDVDEQVASKVSIMPMGVLNKLTREEILDLLAYVVSRGDSKNEIFAGHDH